MWREVQPTTLPFVASLSCIEKSQHGICAAGKKSSAAMPDILILFVLITMRNNQ